ncbi:sensor domain-containing diguanylate cyclase [Rhodanobacter sp. DHB23]|uniref:diguanylate cyclase n=1 Tax=Rhodanobacter sp. DHB23 TaxID=2775923 RepID=UPI0017854794|nr:diguanylate cyclase [Rhodanobacter sp. DHB23]
MARQSAGQGKPTHEPKRVAQTTLSRRVHRFRMLGMGVAALPIAAVLHENGWSPWLAALLAFTGLIWPQLARWLARRSATPFQAELHNLMVDSLLAGLWVPLMHFNLLPAVLLPTVATADKINTGIRGLWLRSLPVMLLGVLVGGLPTGFAVRLQTSTLVILACLPLLVVHTLAVSLGTYRLIRTVQGRNRQLAALSRQDPLTGLANHRHWREESARLLAERSAQGLPSTLLMIDMDRLKAINDEYGHGAGDDALCRLAALIRRHAGPEALAGRLGGDEFSVMLPCGRTHAAAIAEQLRETMAAARWPQRPGLCCTISVGLIEAGEVENTLHDWSEAADRAMYRAKQSGRNRIASDESVAS